MSKSVRNYTDFTAKSHSTTGMPRQNSQFRLRGILRLLLVCLLSVALTLNAYTQIFIPDTPPDWSGWERLDLGANPVEGENFLYDAFLEVASRWTVPVDSSTLVLVGCLHGTGGQWAVQGNLDNLEWLPAYVEDAWGVIDNMETLIVTGHLNNIARIWSIEDLYAHSITNTGHESYAGKILGYGSVGSPETANRGTNIHTTEFLINQGAYALIDGSHDVISVLIDEEIVYVGTGPGSEMRIGTYLHNLDGATIVGYHTILVNQELLNRNATIDGTSSAEAGDVTLMHIGGDLRNINDSIIRGYSLIDVEGGLVNQGSRFIGGHWNNHVSGFPTGSISIGRNVQNVHEVRQNTVPEIFGGLIASFDYLHVHGSVFNDMYSTITGNYTLDGEEPLYGRRANVNSITMSRGTVYDGRTELNIEGLVNLYRDTPEVPAFYGLYNQGYIGEIDVIYVGVAENAVLWNARPTITPDWGARTIDGTPTGTLIRELDRHYGHIYDIGIIDVTNLYNSGTISEVDVAITVTYGLFNDMLGVIDGLSTFHTEWDYTGLIDNEDPAIDQPIRTVVNQRMRADLTVGRTTAANPLLGLGYIEEGVVKTMSAGDGIFNFGTITNFDTITSDGHLHNYGAIGSPVMTNAGSVGGVTAIIVGDNQNEAARADMYNYGRLENIDAVVVTRNLTLGTGTSLANVWSISARNNVRVEGEVDGGFRFLSASEGFLLVRRALTPGETVLPADDWQRDSAQRRIVDPVTRLPLLRTDAASLTIDHAAFASGNTAVQNYGTIVNNGLLSSSMSILNHGIIENNGMISAFSGFDNHGVVSGDGMVQVANGAFTNTQNGIISGSLTISGNFLNNNGTIILTSSQDVIRITNAGATAIVGGTLDIQYSNAVVGRQYMFMAADNAGKLTVSPSGLNGLNTGKPGSVLDFTPSWGYWDGQKYVDNSKSGNQTLNQYYWVEFERAYHYGMHAHTPNQIAIGNYIDTIGLAPIRDSGLWNLFQQLDGISDGYSSGNVNSQGNVLLDNPHYNPNYGMHQGRINPAALKALEELSGSIYSNLGVASAQNVGVVKRSLADILRSDVFQFSFIGNPNNAIRGQAIAPLRYTRWGTVFGIGGSSGNDGNANGYRQSFGGVMGGIDRAFWTGTRFGGWFSLATGDVSMSNVSESTDVTNVMVGVYMRQEMYFGYGLVTVGFGGDSYKTTRNLTMINHRAESKFNSGIASIYLERGIDLPIYYATIQPYASFQALRIDQDKFTEKMWNQYGNLTQVGLEGDKGKTESYMMSIGARTSSSPIAMRWGQAAFTANASWFHDFNGDRHREFVGRFSNSGNNYGVQYANAKFKIASNDPKQDWFNFGVGLHMDRNSTRAFLGADMLTNERQTLYSVFGGISTSW